VKISRVTIVGTEILTLADVVLYDTTGGRLIIGVDYNISMSTALESVSDADYCADYNVFTNCTAVGATASVTLNLFTDQVLSQAWVLRGPRDGDLGTYHLTAFDEYGRLVFTRELGHPYGLRKLFYIVDFAALAVEESDSCLCYEATRPVTVSSEQDCQERLGAAGAAVSYTPKQLDVCRVEFVGEMPIQCQNIWLYRASGSFLSPFYDYAVTTNMTDVESCFGQASNSAYMCQTIDPTYFALELYHCSSLVVHLQGCVGTNGFNSFLNFYNGQDERVASYSAEARSVQSSMSISSVDDEAPTGDCYAFDSSILLDELVMDNTLANDCSYWEKEVCSAEETCDNILSMLEEQQYSYLSASQDALD
jgi:hypothetical protein